MSPLSLAKDCLAVVDTVYSIDNRSEMLQAFIEKLKRIVPLSTAAIFRFTGGANFRQHFTDYFSYNVSEGVIASYCSYYQALHPMVLVINSNKGRDFLAYTRNKAVRITDCIQESVLAEMEYHCDFQSQSNIFYEICVNSYHRRHAIAAWGIQRSKNMGDFRNTEIDTINLLLPHFAKAMHNINMREKKRPSKSGTIIINDEGRAIYMDDNAKEILKGKSKSVLKNIIEFGPVLGAKGDMSFVFSEESGNKYSVTTEPSENGDGQKIIHLDHLASPESGFLSRLADFDLTRRQHEIVILVIQGLSNHEIAEKLFISEQTVKDHLQDAFEKIGVNRRSKLIAKLLGLYPYNA